MKAINEIAERAAKAITQGSARPCRDKPPLEDKLISRLFAVMTVKYDHKWTSRYPNDAMLEAGKREWSRELGLFTSGQIAYAVDNVVDHHPDFPPTIGQFKLLCRAGENKDLYRHPRLANPTDKETALERLKKLKELLK